MKKLFIYGASGHGKVVYELAKLNGYEIVGFIDDASPKYILAYNSISFENFIASHKDCAVALGIGVNDTREKIYNRLLESNIEIATLIHPTSVISSFSSIENGSVVMAGAVINPDTKIGVGSIINTGTVVDHDCRISDFTHIAPNSSVAGGVSIGKRSFIGIGSCVIQNIEISSDVIVGAGSVVIKNLKESRIYKGNPAK
ncbi:MAG: acetyltransferase [Campylobacterales bacterium]|nr:acetyltransferase [Campylobacterales bacterium]